MHTDSRSITPGTVLSSLRACDREPGYCDLVRWRTVSNRASRCLRHSEPQDIPPGLNCARPSAPRQYRRQHHGDRSPCRGKGLPVPHGPGRASPDGVVFRFVSEWLSRINPIGVGQDFPGSSGFIGAIALRRGFFFPGRSVLGRGGFRPCGIVGRLAGWQVGRLAGWQVGRLAGSVWASGSRIGISVFGGLPKGSGVGGVCVIAGRRSSPFRRWVGCAGGLGLCG